MTLQQIETLKSGQKNIDATRLELLEKLAALIIADKQKNGIAKVNFICTHNSRRSQLSELMFQQCLLHYKMEGIQCFSGGTEATAFNYRMVNAVQSFGIQLIQMGPENNPLYIADGSQYLFSKTYDHPFNPSRNIIAVTTCSDADVNCPHIPGADQRMHLGFEDPKHSDDQPDEAETYSAKVIEIGAQMLKLTELIQEKSS